MRKIESLTETELNKLPKLPNGWEWVRLGTLADDIQYGYTKSSTNEPIGPKFLRITDIQNNKVIWESVPYCEIDENEKQKYSLKEGDLVFARTGATVGKSYLLKGPFPESVFASYLIRVRFSKSMLEPFVYNFFQSLIYWKQITEGQVGIGQPNVNGTKLSLLIVPVAPLPEQRAIVSRIEQLFSELDNGIANFRLAQEQLKVYRQAVLKKAFEGELTRKWREQQTDLPDARDLLEQIRIEREEAAKASGKKVKPVKPLNEDEIAQLPGLPEGWGWVKLEVFGELFCGQSPSNAEVNQERKGILYVTGPEQWNGSKIKETKWTEFPKRVVPDGCVFITVKGAGVGKLFPGVACAIGRDIYAFLPSPKVDVKYIIHALMHEIDLIIVKAQGDIPGLSKNHILDHYIGFCSIKEQHAIVEEIETRLSVCDKMAQDIEEALEKAEALRQSILKKAFEGKLLSERELAEVRMAEDWEPADVLLERIKVKKEGKEKR